MHTDLTWLETLVILAAIALPVLGMLAFSVGALWVVWRSFGRVECAQRDLLKMALSVSDAPHAAKVAVEMEVTDRAIELKSMEKQVRNEKRSPIREAQ